MKHLIKGLLALFFCASVFAQTNITSTIRSSLPATTTVTTSVLTNSQWKGGHVIINVTGLSSGTFTPKIQGRDPVSGNYYDILTGSTISGTGTTVLKAYPGITATTNTVSDIIPYNWRVMLVGASTPVGTLSIGASLAP